MEEKLLKMVLFLREIKIKEKKNMENMNGKIKIVMRDILKMIYFTAKVNINGEIKKCTLGIGKKVKWMVKEN